MMQASSTEILEENSRPSYVYVISAIAALSGLLFGFDIAVSNGAIIFLRQQFRLSDFQTEIAASSLLLGCVVGASIAGILSERFGLIPSCVL